MMRTLSIFTVLSLVSGCTTAPDPLRVAPLPLAGPVNGVPEALFRARSQATAATEAFFLDDWARLDTIGQALEDTAAQLGKMPVPEPKQIELRDAAAKLGTQAKQLRAAALKKDTMAVSAAISQIGTEVRNLQASFGATITEQPQK